MAGIIDYIGSGVIESASNTNTGTPSAKDKKHSMYFDVESSTGGPLVSSGVKPVDFSTTYPTQQIAAPASQTASPMTKFPYDIDNQVSYYQGNKPVIDSTGGKTFATSSVNPFKGVSVEECIKDLNKSLNIMDDSASVYAAFKNLCVTKYNRFKTPNYNEVLSRGFPHVFFVKPDCNILKSVSSGGLSLSDDNAWHGLFQYLAQANPELLSELNLTSCKGNSDFMLSLSNRVISFNANDEAIETGDYGTTYTGYKIAYGKNDVKSKTAGQISLQVRDDRNFYMYQLIRCWVEYISGVYRGELAPLKNNIIDKILDYTSAIYYIITAEDGETILFWSKYYGVFPTSIPATQYSWAAGNTIYSPDLNVEFQYSFKKDFTPDLIAEFNHNARVTSATNYESTYDPFLNSVGRSWVGAPFIEVANNTQLGGNPYELKLRFRRGD